LESLHNRRLLDPEEVFGYETRAWRMDAGT